jgi:hypothetical protein
MRKALLVLLFMLVADGARANLSFVGELDETNPNDVFMTTFSLASRADLVVRTWGFGGTGGAPGGTNAAGAAIAGGGFDPYLSLFGGRGATATFLASNDDGACPPATSLGACADSTLLLVDLAPGVYTLALTLPFNYSFAENLGVGTLGDGFIGLDAGFSDGSCASRCSNRYAFDILSSALVEPRAAPEPATVALCFVGLFAAGARMRPKQRSSITRETRSC